MASELSKQAKSLRDELSSHTLFDATISCLNQDKYGPISDASPEKLIKALSDEMKRNHDTTFLCSSISAIKVDSITVRRAEKWASNGFTIHGKTYQLQRPFNWDTYPGATRNHRYKIQAWLMIDELLRASEIDNRLDFFEIARNVAIDWIDEFIFGQRSDDYAWYDMGTGQRAALLAHITQKSLLTLTSIRNKKRRINLHNDILKLMIACQIHISELMDYERLALHSNHGLFQMSGLLALSKSVPVLSLATEGESFAINGINEMLSDHFFLDGFHKEHSPMYHMYVSNYLHQLEEAMWLPGSNNLSKLAQKAKISVQKYIMPDGFFAPIGDSSLSNRADALCIFPIHKDSNGTPSAPPGIHIFPEGGVAIISTTTKKGVADEHMVFTGQFHSRQHKHADDLSINYCVKGKRYLIDAGTFTYHYDQEERMYVESTRAHNTIEIDGLNSSRFRLDTYGSALKRVIKVGDCTILDGTVHHKRLIQPTIPNNKIKTEDASIVDITHRRIVLHKAQHFMAIIDILDSENDHEYIQWFHLSPHLRSEIISDVTREVTDSTGQIHSTIHHIPPTSTHSQLLDIFGQQKPMRQGFHSINGLELEPHNSIGFSTKSNNTVLATVFDLKGGKKKPYLNVGSNGKYIRFAINEDNNSIDIRIREQKDRQLVVELDGSQVSFEQLYHKE